MNSQRQSGGIKIELNIYSTEKFQFHIICQQQWQSHIFRTVIMLKWFVKAVKQKMETWHFQKDLRSIFDNLPYLLAHRRKIQCLNRDRGHELRIFRPEMSCPSLVS